MVWTVKDLTGQRFERLVVIAIAGKRNRVTVWHCRCECGRTVIVRGGNLQSGTTRSCGCLLLDTLHARRQSDPKYKMPEYRAYFNAQDRCINPKHRQFRHYGGRGIEFRLPPFDVFIRVLGRRPAGHTLDRIDNNGHYELDNVRWATPKTQAQNRRQRPKGIPNVRRANLLTIYGRGNPVHRIPWDDKKTHA